MTTVLKITEDDFDAALDIADAELRIGKIIIYPTDTVYGIGCDATNAEAVKKIFEIKKCSPRPLSVMVGDFGSIDYYCETGLWEDITLKRYLPGPYTFILKKQRPLPASDTEKLGIRMPDNYFCRNLSLKFGRPIITTSANTSGKKAPMSFQDIEKEILDSVDLAIDAGETRYKEHSVVVDLVEHKMKRMGEEIDLIEFPER